MLSASSFPHPRLEKRHPRKSREYRLMFLFDRNEKVKGKRNEGKRWDDSQNGKSAAHVERTLLSAAFVFV
ncbi:hypothetical protein SBA1_250003 [Candidatus Sulfotelmatobacter kueseliae]|uniref:Uncharacterized protein n=1 Tax=Candidatus Sulfotelmatobacter kueseliae TaxID=2042962 RepID=A0A2U3KHP1_9BACT|nr:hypothetical protein SBA1_250003 [Candidatus Sulfotelmatobacter kueseliae]